MTTIAGSLRLMVQSVKVMYKNNVPPLDETQYRGRSYTLAAAKCYAAAYAAAVCNRDNMAMQFYRAALRISDALAPEYPKERDHSDNEKDRATKDQLALNSKLQAAQMGIASQYGLLAYLDAEKKGGPFLFINMYREAHKACRVAHDEAKDLRHSPIDAEFADVIKDVVEAIGVYYNVELAAWTEPVKAAQENRVPELTPDTYIAETLAQRHQHSNADLDNMMQAEQLALGHMTQDQSGLASELMSINNVIVKQTEVTKLSHEVYEKMKNEIDELRKDLEKQSGQLSELSMERSNLRVKLAVVDSNHFLQSERLQTLVNLRAYTE
jgi:hypothetical protein